MAADPAPVAGFSATVDPQTAAVVVQWTDQAAPDATYQVYRSAGTFNPDDATLVGTTTPGGTTVDDTVATIPGADDGGVTYGLVPVDPNVAVPLQDGDGDLPPLDGVVTLQPVGFIPPVVMDPANAPKKASSTIVAGQAIVTITVPGAAFPGTGKPTLAGALNIATTGARTNPTVAPPPPAPCPPGQVQFGSAVLDPATGDWTVTVTVGTGLVTAGGQVWVTIGSSVGGYSGTVQVQ